MKLIQLDNYFINLDKVVYVDLEEYQIHMTDGIIISIKNEDQLNLFISKYNQINTNQFESSIEILADTLSRNSDLLTRRQLEEQIIIAVRNNQLEEYLKEQAEGVRLQDMSITKLVEVHRIIKTKIQSDHLDLPF